MLYCSHRSTTWLKRIITARVDLCIVARVLVANPMSVLLLRLLRYTHRWTHIERIQAIGTSPRWISTALTPVLVTSPVVYCESKTIRKTCFVGRILVYIWLASVAHREGTIIVARCVDGISCIVIVLAITSRYSMGRRDQKQYKIEWKKHLWLFNTQL